MNLQTPNRRRTGMQPLPWMLSTFMAPTQVGQPALLTTPLPAIQDGPSFRPPTIALSQLPLLQRSPPTLHLARLIPPALNEDVMRAALQALTLADKLGLLQVTTGRGNAVRAPDFVLARVVVEQLLQQLASLAVRLASTQTASAAPPALDRALGNKELARAHALRLSLEGASSGQEGLQNSMHAHARAALGHWNQGDTGTVRDLAGLALVGRAMAFLGASEPAGAAATLLALFVNQPLLAPWPPSPRPLRAAPYGRETDVLQVRAEMALTLTDLPSFARVCYEVRQQQIDVSGWWRDWQEAGSSVVGTALAAELMKVEAETISWRIAANNAARLGIAFEPA